MKRKIPRKYRYKPPSPLPEKRFILVWGATVTGRLYAQEVMKV